MKVIKFFDENEKSNEHVSALIEARDRRGRQGASVFRSHAPANLPDDSATNFTFTTTSKDVALMLGTFTLKELRHLGHFLDDGFENGQLTELMALRGDDLRGGVYVTRSESGNEVNFSLSPAR